MRINSATKNERLRKLEDTRLNLEKDLKRNLELTPALFFDQRVQGLRNSREHKQFLQEKQKEELFLKVFLLILANFQQRTTRKR